MEQEYWFIVYRVSHWGADTPKGKLGSCVSDINPTEVSDYWYPYVSGDKGYHFPYLKEFTIISSRLITKEKYNECPDKYDNMFNNDESLKATIARSTIK